VHTEENTAANVGTEGAAQVGANANTSGAAEGAAAPVVVPSNPRRKRKAKGWFCPVCRQPYTSLLRISATPPTKDISDDDNRASTIDNPDHEGGNDHGQDGDEGDNHYTTPTVVTSDPLSATATTAPILASGGMMNTLRSSFRRNLALNPSRSESETLPRDVERGTDVPTTVV